MTLQISCSLTGMAIEDHAIADAIAATGARVHLRADRRRVIADIFGDADDFVSLVRRTIAAVASVAPGVALQQVEEDFVNTSEIADRTDVSREAVRLWSLRDDFPTPRDTVGRMKIWDWPTVNSWLLATFDGALGDPYRLPNPAEIADVNAMLTSVRRHRGSTRHVTALRTTTSK